MTNPEQLAAVHEETAAYWYARADKATTTDDQNFALREAGHAELMAADILARTQRNN